MTEYDTWVYNGKRLHVVKCVLGENYHVYYRNQIILGKFIKVTNKGYNFLHEASNQCIFPRHWFIPRKWQNKSQGPIKMFRVPIMYDARKA